MAQTTTSKSWFGYLPKLGSWFSNAMTENFVYDLVKGLAPKMLFDKVIDAVKDKISPEHADSFEGDIKAKAFGFGLEDEQIITSLFLLLHANLAGLGVTARQYSSLLKDYKEMKTSLRRKLRLGLAKEPTEEKQLVLLAELAKLGSTERRCAAIAAYTEPSAFEQLDQKAAPLKGFFEKAINDRLTTIRTGVPPLAATAPRVTTASIISKLSSCITVAVGFLRFLFSRLSSVVSIVSNFVKLVLREVGSGITIVSGYVKPLILISLAIIVMAIAAVAVFMAITYYKTNSLPF